MRTHVHCGYCSVVDSWNWQPNLSFPWLKLAGDSAASLWKTRAARSHCVLSSALARDLLTISVGFVKNRHLS